MKIGWIKYTGLLEIGDNLLYTSGTTSIRTNLFKAILAKGHGLTLFSPVGKKTEAFLKTEEGAKHFGKIKVKVKDKIDKNIDFLVVENGTDNINFSWNIDGEHVPSPAYINRLISSFKGVCFYMQTDPDLPFIFFPEFYSNDFITKYLSNGNSQSLLGGKRFIVASSSKKQGEEFFQYNSKLRASYPMLKKSKLVDFERLEMHYTCLKADKDYKPIKKPSKGLVYIGGQRKRKNELKEFYGVPGSNGVPVEIYGKWDQRAVGEIPDVEWKGVLGRGLVHSTYNDSFGSVIIGDPIFQKTGFVSGRFFELIASRSLPLLDLKLVESSISDLLSEELIKELVVENGKQVAEKYARLNNTSHRKDLIKECARATKKYDSGRVVDDLLQLFERYNTKPIKNKGRGFRRKANKVLEGLLNERKGGNFNVQYHDFVLGEINRKRTKLNKGGAYADEAIKVDTEKRCPKCGAKQETFTMCKLCKDGIDIEKRKKINLKKVKNKK